MIPRFWEHLGEQGFDGAAFEREATALLGELAWWARALSTAREAGQ
jgi:hypothetical protein